MKNPEEQMLGQTREEIERQCGDLPLKERQYSWFERGTNDRILSRIPVLQTEAVDQLFGKLTPRIRNPRAQSGITNDDVHFPPIAPLEQTEPVAQYTGLRYPVAMVSRELKDTTDINPIALPPSVVGDICASVVEADAIIAAHAEQAAKPDGELAPRIEIPNSGH